MYPIFQQGTAPGHPIRLHPLPGLRGIDPAQRNFLLIERRGGDWQAIREPERSGPTAPRALVQRRLSRAALR